MCKKIPNNFLYFTIKEYKIKTGIIQSRVDYADCTMLCKLGYNSGRRIKCYQLCGYHRFREFKSWKYYRKKQYKNV